MNTPPILLPDVSDFAALLDYRGEWDHEHRPDVAPRIIGSEIGERRRGNEIGPFGTIENVAGHPRRSFAAVATDATIDAIAPRIVTPDDSLSFKVYGRPDGRAVVVVSHNYIIGSHWLAEIDAATLPAYPYALRDARRAEITDAIREMGGSPYRHRAPAPHVIVLSDGRDGKRATIDPDGSVMREWPDGTISHEPARR